MSINPQKQHVLSSRSWVTYIKAALSKVALYLLSKFLDIIIVLLLRRGKPGRLDVNQKKTAKLIKDSIYTRLVVEGYLSKGRGKNRYPEWEDLNTFLYKQSLSVSNSLTGKEQDIKIGLEKLLNKRFNPGDQVQALIDGPASFELRYRLITEAKESIYIATWKLYGDETGKKMIDELLNKHQSNPDIDIRIMVDGNVATQDPKSIEQLKRLTDAGLPVVFHHNDEWPFNGFHYKLTVFDGASANPIAITGGMNIGNEYSHGFGTPIADDPNRKLWRDTDVCIIGPTAREDYLIFTSLWNDRVAHTNSIEPFRQALSLIHLKAKLPQVINSGDAQILTIIDEPGPQSKQQITLSMVFCIHAAKQSIDIENAYFMHVPAINDALVEALKRGVKVRVLTNSSDSVDEKVVAVPIMKGLYTLLDNAEAADLSKDRCLIYTQKKLRPHLHNADTLHSKFMIVDREICQITSFNIHARSLRLEVEGSHYIINKELANTLTLQFNKDLYNALPVRHSSEIDFPDDLVSKFLRYMHLDPVLM